MNVSNVFAIMWTVIFSQNIKGSHENVLLEIWHEKMGKIILFSHKDLYLCVIAAYCSIDLSHAQPHVPEEISNCKGNLEHMKSVQSSNHTFYRVPD